MKINYLKAALLLFTVVTQAQLYISNNASSFVYSDNALVYVTGNIELNGANSNFYLRNNGQLLQGTTGLGTNRGLGSLSVYQEGTSNNFQYNYWCSPVGQKTAAAQNESFGLNLMYLPSVADKITSVPATTTASYNGTVAPGALAISTSWIWKYIASNIYGLNTGGWQYVGSASNILPAGLGFTMKGTSGTDALVSDPKDGIANAYTTGVAPNIIQHQRYDFRGKPNDGTITAAVHNVAGASYDNMTLVGNPYPSAINLNLYLLENAGYTVNYTTGVVTGPPAGGTIANAAYFWEQSKNSANNTHLVGNYVGGYGEYIPNNVNAFSPGTYNIAPFRTYSADGENITGGAGSGSSYERMFTPIGQGFMVRGVTPTSNVTMRNRYRAFRAEGVANNSQFEKSSDESKTNTNNWEAIPNVANVDYTQFSKLPTPQVKIITLVDNDFVIENTIAINPNSSDDFEGFDGLTTAKNLEKSSYFKTISNEKLCITTLPFDIDKKIPFVLKNTANANSTFKIKVSNFINFEYTKNVYLHDKITDEYFDIVTNTKEIVLNSTEEDRYEVTFKNAALTATDNNIEAFEIYQNNQNEMLTIVNKTNSDVLSCDLFDISGKRVMSQSNLGTNQLFEIPTQNLSEGVYIVKVNALNQKETVKKVIVSHKK